MMPNRVARTSTLLFFASLTVASAAGPTVWDECRQTPESDISIVACTNILQAPDETPSNRAIAYYARAGAYKTKGDKDRAIADYTKAIEANPIYADAFTGRGIVYQSKGDNDRAIADYTKAIEINPRYANAYVGRGMVYRLKGDSDHAVADYTKAIEINSSYAIAYLNSTAASSSRRGANAIWPLQILTKAIDLDPRGAEAFVRRGAVYQAAGDKDRAIADYTKASSSIRGSPRRVFAAGCYTASMAIATARYRIMAKRLQLTGSMPLPT
jgi:tetratricopeptide (TPR) repeat protein